MLPTLNDIRNASLAVEATARRVRDAGEDLRRAARARDEMIGAVLDAEFGPGLVLAGRGWISGRARLTVRCRDLCDGWEALIVSDGGTTKAAATADTPRAACHAAIDALPRKWETEASGLRDAVAGRVAATTWSKH